uniref:Uncharacterized protein n=1 Tax=Myoviridae sp. ctlnK45 TaxID=2826693 RepID=A0A8S5NQ55_9CAUD|nr:MAG TPA: hypothetical protein [Myoviridae sp. ctlnK45]
MNGLILFLSLICGAASIGTAVCAVLILRLLREIKAPSPTEPEKPEAEEPTDRQKSVEQGIDNLMTYGLDTMKASLKGREV